MKNFKQFLKEGKTTTRYTVGRSGGNDAITIEGKEDPNWLVEILRDEIVITYDDKEFILPMEHFLRLVNKKFSLNRIR